MDSHDAAGVNLEAKRKWLQIGSQSELACGVIVRGAVWWFKARVGERTSRIDGPFFNLDMPPKPKEASPSAAQIADKALVDAVRRARFNFSH